MHPVVPLEDFRIQNVLLAIKSDPSVRIADLARRVNLSTSRLAHLFKAQIGLSLNAFLTNQRLERAAHLLRDTEMRIKEITYCIGYGHEPSFNRAFKKRFEHSPQSYRKRYRATGSIERLAGVEELSLDTDSAGVISSMFSLKSNVLLNEDE
jgi:transcriptional regulator GlxA family with amidase domain